MVQTDPGDNPHPSFDGEPDMSSSHAAQPHQRVRRWSRRMIRTAFWVSVLLIVSAAAVKYWVGPMLVRRAIRRQLPTYWDGWVQIEEVDVRFDASVRLIGVTLHDRGGRVWMRASDIETGSLLGPGLTLQVRRLHLDSLAVQMHFVAGRPLEEWETPLRNTDRLIRWLEEVTSIDELTAAGTISLVCTDGGRFDTGPLQLSVHRAVRGHRVQLRRLATEPGEAIEARGGLEWGSSDLEMTLLYRQRIQPGEGAVLAEILGIPGIEKAGGVVSADLETRGRWTQPLSWRPKGACRFSEWTVSTPAGDLLSGLGAEVSLANDPNGVSAELTTLDGTLCEGRLRARGRWAVTPGNANRVMVACETAEYSGRVALDGVELGELMPAVASIVGRTALTREQGRRSTGRLHARYDLTGRGCRLGGLRGRGAVSLRGANLWAFPVVSDLIGQFRSRPSGALSRADMEAAVRSRGAVVTIEEARVVSPFYAIDVEPGGTLNLRDARLDLYAVGVPLEKLTDALSKVPLLNLIPFLQKSLSRVHLEGRWDRPDGIEISSAPMPDRSLGRDAREFFLQAAKTGGDFPGHLLDRFGKWFDRGE
ncbi:MAG: hypothetical protein ACLFV7_08660 [Phycisphaerae bacterium]